MISREQVKKAFKLIHRRADFEFFFDNLKSIDWLDPLVEEGVFKTPDAPIKHSNNSISFPFWPPGQYLARVASQDPNKVLNVILSADETDNPRVHEAFLEAALAMPANLSVQLKDKAISWLTNQHQMFLPRKVALYVAHLSEGAFKAEALLVAAALFDIRMTPDKIGKNKEIVFKRTHPIIRNDWEYGECLKIVAQAFKGQEVKLLITLLSEVLEKALILEDRLDENEFMDHSHIWRGSIENSNQNQSYEIKDTLINWIRDLSEQFLKENFDACVKLCDWFRKSKLPIFSRFALHLVRQTTDQNLVTKFILDKDLFESHDVWHEYALLIQDRFNLLDENNQKTFFQLVETHQPFQVLLKDDPEEFARANERAKYRYYYMIREHLAGDQLKRFKDLHSQFGELEHPTFSTYSMSWSGPNSPKSVEELEQYSIQQIVEFLTTWKPPESRRLGPEDSIDGLSFELEKLVTKKPEFFVNGIDHLKFSEELYVRAIIQGLSSKIEDSTFDWSPVMNYVVWAANQGAIFSSGRVITAACKILERGFTSKNHQIPLSYKQVVWSVITIGLKDTDPDTTREEKYTSDKNFYQTAINSTRGIALETALQYGIWVKKNVESENKKFLPEHVTELFLALDKHVDPKLDPSKAIHSVFGRWTPWIKVLNVDWFRKNIAVIYPSDPALSVYWQAAWRSYILYNYPYSDVFDEIKDQYVRAVNELIPEDKESSEKVDERLVHHVITFYLSSKIDLDSELMKSLYEKTNLRLRKSIISFIGRSVSAEKKNMSAEMVKRSEDLWFNRIKACEAMPNQNDRLELSAFGSWMDSKHFSQDWILDQAITVLNLCHHLTPDYIVMGRLIDFADQQSIKAAKVFQMLVDYKVNDQGLYGWLYKGEEVLKKLLKTNAKEVAIEIIHKLGAYGYREFGNLLKEDKQ